MKRLSFGRISAVKAPVPLTRLSVFRPDVWAWKVATRAAHRFYLLFPYRLLVMVANIQQSAHGYYLFVHYVPNGKFKSVLSVYPYR